MENTLENVFIKEANNIRKEIANLSLMLAGLQKLWPDSIYTSDMDKAIYIASSTQGYGNNDGGGMPVEFAYLELDNLIHKHAVPIQLEMFHEEA